MKATHERNPGAIPRRTTQESNQGEQPSREQSRGATQDSQASQESNPEEPPRRRAIQKSKPGEQSKSSSGNHEHQLQAAKIFQKWLKCLPKLTFEILGNRNVHEKPSLEKETKTPTNIYIAPFSKSPTSQRSSCTVSKTHFLNLSEFQQIIYTCLGNQRVGRSPLNCDPLPTDAQQRHPRIHKQSSPQDLWRSVPGNHTSMPCPSDGVAARLVTPSYLK